MTLHYVLMDPTKNITILVLTPVPPDLHSAAAARVMALEPTAEQVGFLTRGEGGVSLRMAGGEFCGNASMSAAVYYAMEQKLTRGQISVTVSGAEQPVSVAFESESEGHWHGTVEMPLPRSLEKASLSGGRTLPVVSFPGISHVILEEALPRKTAEILARRWCRELHADALGLMFLDRAEKNLTPLVYVPEADTLFWESSCASGTSAAGAWLAREAGGPITVSLRQPGGVLEISAAPGGPILLTGTVQLLYSKSAEIDLPLPIASSVSHENK